MIESHNAAAEPRTNKSVRVQEMYPTVHDLMWLQDTVRGELSINISDHTVDNLEIDSIVKLGLCGTGPHCPCACQAVGICSQKAVGLQAKKRNVSLSFVRASSTNRRS